MSEKYGLKLNEEDILFLTLVVSQFQVDSSRSSTAINLIVTEIRVADSKSPNKEFSNEHSNVPIVRAGKLCRNVFLMNASILRF